jgi:hypothetical protein
MWLLETFLVLLSGDSSPWWSLMGGLGVPSIPQFDHSQAYDGHSCFSHWLAIESSSEFNSEKRGHTLKVSDSIRGDSPDVKTFDASTRIAKSDHNCRMLYIQTDPKSVHSHDLRFDSRLISTRQRRIEEARLSRHAAAQHPS